MPSEAADVLRTLTRRAELRSMHAVWSRETFGTVGPIGPLKHLSKEALEAAERPEDLSEWADLQFLLWDAQRRAGITDEQLNDAMERKLAINQERDWPPPVDGEPVLHERAPIRDIGGESPNVVWTPGDQDRELTLLIDGIRRGGLTVWTCNTTGEIAMWALLLAGPAGDQEGSFYATLEEAKAALLAAVQKEPACG